MSDDLDDKPKRPLKKLLEKQARGDLDDLTSEEVGELTAYARFATQVEIETEMSQRIAAEMEAVNAKFRNLKAEYEDLLARGQLLLRLGVELLAQVLLQHSNIHSFSYLRI